MASSPKTILITGANRGIGFEFVQQLRKLSKKPAIIIATFRKIEDSTELFKVAQADKTILPVQLDVTDTSSYAKFVSHVEGLLGENGLNLLINNAGIANKVAGMDAMSEEQLLRHFRVNCIGPTLLTRSLFPLLKKAAKKGPVDGNEFTWARAAIINITSSLGSIAYCTDNLYYSYRISKAGLNMATKVMANDIRADGILAVSLHPGWVKTDMGGRDYADLEIDYSVSTMIKAISKFGGQDQGMYFNVDGMPLPF